MTNHFWTAMLAGFRAMGILEWVAVVTSFFSVYLTVRNSIWNWLWGFFGVVLYGILFFQYKNYANCGLQILYFLPIQFIGWYVWKRGGPTKSDDLPVTRLSNRARAGWIAITAALTFPLWLILRLPQVADPLPFADGLTTAISITAQYLQVYKRFENWLLWIIADVIYCAYLFPVQKLWASAALYLVFTILAIIGAKDWVKIMRRQRMAVAVSPIAD